MLLTQKTIFLLLFISLIFDQPLSALDPHKRITQYDIRVYTAKDGLPMNSIKKVFQDSRGYIYLDPDKMEKVFINLLSNAIKFTPTGGKVTLSVDPLNEKDKAINIRVADTGIGIPPHLLPHIFDYFYRYRDEKNYQQSGSGIGLALTKELVHLHHGEITVTSAEGAGTEFIVSLLLGKRSSET